MAWLVRTEVDELGFASVGDDVLISNKATFYGCSKISIGDNVRIDDFCILSAGDGGITIGNSVHLGAYTCLIGGGAIILEEFASLSTKVSIFSKSDDFSGESMTNPGVPEQYRNVLEATVTVGRNVVIGSGSTVLPGVHLQNGVAVGAMSLIKADCEEFSVYVGVPAKKIKERKKGLLQKEDELAAAKLRTKD